jgi:exonuclease SbcC
MRLKKISLKNIRSYENQEIEFPDGSLLLAGDVGSGKTSILLAVEYVLFGLQPGQKGSALLKNNADFAEVSLEMEIDGKNIVIERGLKRTSKGIVNDYSAITIDGERRESSTTEIKIVILKLLNYPSEFIKKNNILFRYTIYTPQEQMKQIILEDPDSRLNVLRHIFGIDKYKRIRENLSILLNRLKEQSRLLQSQIISLGEDKMTLDLRKNLLVDVKCKIGILESNVLERKNFRKDIEKEVQDLEIKIREKIGFEKEVEKTKVMIATKRESLSVINRDILDLESSLTEISRTYSESEFIKALSELDEKNKSIETINKRYIEIIGEINNFERQKKENTETKERVFGIKFCPTCLQDVSTVHRHNIILSAESKISDINVKISLLSGEKENMAKNLESAKKERTILEDKKLELEILKSKRQLKERSEKKLDELKKVKIGLENDISLLVEHVEGLKAAILSFVKFENFMKSKQLELRRAFSDEKEVEISLAETKKELEFSIRSISELEKNIKEKEFLKEKLTHLLELLDWLSNHYLPLTDFIERSVMIKLRSEFSILFNQWFNMLVPESFEAQLDENFTPIIVQSGVEMDYSFLSGGERTAVALAYRLALNQTINSVLSQIKTRDIVILDEPTEGFSEVQIDKMRDVFHELDVSQLIIVSHEPKMESFVDNVIRIKKEQGSSKVS